LRRPRRPSHQSWFPKFILGDIATFDILLAYCLPTKSPSPNIGEEIERIEHDPLMPFGKRLIVQSLVPGLTRLPVLWS
jgi:hypothetical protein